MKNPAGKNPKVKELKSLVECCPQGHNLLNLDCPVRNIRKLNDQNLNRALGQMSMREIEHIIDYHKNCSRKDELSCYH